MSVLGPAAAWEAHVLAMIVLNIHDLAIAFLDTQRMRITTVNRNREGLRVTVGFFDLHLQLGKRRSRGFHGGVYTLAHAFTDTSGRDQLLRLDADVVDRRHGFQSIVQHPARLPQCRRRALCELHRWLRELADLRE